MLVYLGAAHLVGSARSGNVVAVLLLCHSCCVWMHVQISSISPLQNNREQGIGVIPKVAQALDDIRVVQLHEKLHFMQNVLE